MKLVGQGNGLRPRLLFAVWQNAAILQRRKSIARRDLTEMAFKCEWTKTIKLWALLEIGDSAMQRIYSTEKSYKKNTNRAAHSFLINTSKMVLEIWSVIWWPFWPYGILRLWNMFTNQRWLTIKMHNIWRLCPEEQAVCGSVTRSEKKMMCRPYRRFIKWIISLCSKFCRNHNKC